MYYRRYTKKILQEAANSSSSIRQMLFWFGLRETGGNHKAMKKRIDKYEIDVSHFYGQRWNKGKNRFEDRRILGKHSFEEIFCRNSKVRPKHFKKILEKIIECRCQICEIENWLGKELVLEVDHINGIGDDNRIENLRFLCPNCHSQTKNFRGRALKGKKRKAVDEQIIIETIKNNKNIHQVLIKLGLAPKGGNYDRIKNIMIKNGLLFEQII